jgi:hypothetical protein
MKLNKNNLNYIITLDFNLIETIRKMDVRREIIKHY